MKGPAGSEQFGGRLVAVAVLGFLLLVPPLVSIFDRGGQVFGIPGIWVYLFLVWAVIIGLVAALVRRSG
jgi:hypothetical protein